MTSSDPTATLAGLLIGQAPDAAPVLRAAFTRIRSGSSPTFLDLADDTGLVAADVEAAVADLVTDGLTVLAEETGGVRVVGVAGLSVVETAHHLDLAGVPLWTWCAFDTIGIPAALGLDARAVTDCGYCSARLTVALPLGQPPTDASTVGWLPAGDCSNVRAQFCPTANLFCDPAHLAAWRADAGDPPGAAAVLAELANLGQLVWNEMRPLPTPPIDTRHGAP